MTKKEKEAGLSFEGTSLQPFLREQEREEQENDGWLGYAGPRIIVGAFLGTSK